MKKQRQSFDKKSKEIWMEHDVRFRRAVSFVMDEETAGQREEEAVCDYFG